MQSGEEYATPEFIQEVSFFSCERPTALGKTGQCRGMRKAAKQVGLVTAISTGPGIKQCNRPAYGLTPNPTAAAKNSSKKIKLFHPLPFPRKITGRAGRKKAKNIPY